MDNDQFQHTETIFRKRLWIQVELLAKRVRELESYVQAVSSHQLREVE